MGAFHCFDPYLQSSFQAFALQHGISEAPATWAEPSPDVPPAHSTYFHENGRWREPPERLFMQWYSDTLLAHVDIMLEAAQTVFQPLAVPLTVKVSSTPPWVGYPSRPGELVAGFSVQPGSDTYSRLLSLLYYHRVGLTVSGVHMAGDCHDDDTCSFDAPLARPVTVLSHLRALATSLHVLVRLEGDFDET